MGPDLNIVSETAENKPDLMFELGSTAYSLRQRRTADQHCSCGLYNVHTYLHLWP